MEFVWFFSDTGLVYAWIYQPIPGLLVVFALALAKTSLHVICPLVTRFDQGDTIVSCMATALTSVPGWKSLAGCVSELWLVQG